MEENKILKDVNFLPWVGTNYNKEGYEGKKILVLGESHYCMENLASDGCCFPECARAKFKDDCPDFTIGVIEWYLREHQADENSKWINTFIAFERNLFGRALTKEEATDFWDRVIFYNYIQLALPKPGVPPKAEYWKCSENAFKEILGKFMPDYVFVWGARLYNGLPDWNGKHSLLQADEYKTDVWTYTINGKEIPVLKVLHPCSSRGKNRAKWNKLYNKFINL